MKNSRFFIALRKTFPFVRPYLFENFLSIFFSLLALLSNLIIPYLIKILLDDILIQGHWEKMTWFSIAGIGTVVFSNLTRYMAGYFYVNFAESIVIDARTNLYNHLVFHDLSFFQKYQLGDLVNRFQDDTAGMHGLFSYVLTTIFINVMTILGTVIIMLNMNVPLTVIVVISLPLYLTVNNLFNGQVRKNVLLRRKEQGVLLNFIFDTLSKIILLKNYVYESRSVQQIREISNNLKKFVVKNEMFTYLASATTNLTTQIVSISLLILGATFVHKGMLTAGGLVAFYSYINNLFSPIIAISNQIIGMNHVIVGAERYFELVEDDTNRTIVSGDIPITDVCGEIEFTGVNFGYSGDIVLQDITFRVKPKEKVAILGRSGIGKTTFAMLLKRFYNPDQGEIRLDGTTISAFNLHQLRSTIGYLPQEPMILEGSIKKNLAVGKENVTTEECWEVLDTVDLLELVEQLPDGLETVLGNNGAQLSGGQKQRLSLARLILQNPPILVFDELFSHLDSQTEQIIWENLKSWLQDKTVIFITHQLWEPEYFDRLVVFNKGIEAEGHYSELRNHYLLKDLIAQSHEEEKIG